MKVLIEKGNHYRNFIFPKIRISDSYNIKYKIKFDSSARYKLDTNFTQVNKLIGIGVVHHHFNSVRIGWRWIEQRNQIELVSYTYKNKERDYKHITWVDINQEFEIYMSVHIVQDNLYYSVYFNKHICDGGTYPLNKWYYKLPFLYTCFPYFGGTEVAPHNITIDVKPLKNISL